MRVVENAACIIDPDVGLDVVDITNCPPCRVDIDGDGTVDNRDLVAFLSIWVDGC